MRLLVRLAMLCLSLALLGGVLLHDLAGAKMSLDMAGTTMTAVEQEGACPACPQESSDLVACDMDCTAPVLSTDRVSRAVALDMRSSRLDMTADLDLAGLDPGSDPFPPRSTFPS